MIDFKVFLAREAAWTPQLLRRGVKPQQLKDLAKKHQELGKLNQELSELQQKRNEYAKSKDQKKGHEIKKTLLEVEKKQKEFAQHFERELAVIPNIPDADVPDGATEDDNVEVRVVGERPEFSYSPKDHLTLGKALDLIDTERAALVSGSRFVYLKNQAVILEFALVRFAMDMLQKEGFQPIIPPVIIKHEIARKTGYPEAVSDDDAFALKKDNLVLVGTSEQSILPYYADTVLDLNQLPQRFVGFSTCFRREAGSYGKDVRGIIRQHQFDKVEMVSFAEPKKSKEEHDFLLSMGEKLTQALELPYRVMLMCIDELAPPQSKKYDIETWLPSLKCYRETHSTSNCTDYQANNFNIRYRADGKNASVHTLNGTALAIGRTLVALLENHQQADGSVVIPKALIPYTGLERIDVPKQK